MSFGFGPGVEMNNAHKRNMGQLNKKISLKEFNRRFPEKETAKTTKEFISPAKLAKFKFDLAEKRKREFKNKVIFGTLFFGLGISLFIWLMFF